jgi:hypothetical protein
MQNRKEIIAATKDYSRISGFGRLLGLFLVKLCEPTIAKLITDGEPDERCSTCAFRAGTVPNGCEQTVMDAVKCVKEDVVFRCHAENKLCYVTIFRKRGGWK